MMKVLSVFGTRPEAIKMAPLIKKLKEDFYFDTYVCVTAQHREMLDQVLDIFNIIPDFDFNIMKKNQNLFDITIKILSSLKDVYDNVKPDIVLVHGDTTTTFAASLAAFYNKIPVGHVEAGLRTYKLYSPYPEEINRELTGRIATYHFVPTENNKQNLLNENVPEKNIFVTGNTVIDTLFMVKKMFENDKKLEENVKNRLPYKILKNRKYILITGHRRENFEKGFINICSALKEVAFKYSDIDFVYPVHLNPNVKDTVYKYLKNISNIFLIPPLDYLSFVYLMINSYFIVTDSGGIQEEAPSLGKPVVVMRDTTERKEAIEAKTVILTGTNKINIVKAISDLIEDENMYKNMAKVINPYGCGKASKIIVDVLKGIKL